MRFRRISGSVFAFLAVMALAVKLRSQGVQDAAVQATGTSSSRGQAVGGDARTVVLSSLPQIAVPVSPRPVEVPLRNGLNPTAVQPGVFATAATGLPSPPPAGFSAETVGPTKSFAGGTETACNGFPSDQALSASTTQVVQVINACIIVLNAASGAYYSGYPKALTTFFGVTGTDNVGDSRTFYDQRNQRFVVVSEDFTTNSFLVAATSGGDATGSWYTYNLAASLSGTGCPDYPMLGQTNHEIQDGKGGIYLSFDRFDASCNAFVDDVVWILSKLRIYSGQSIGTFNYIFNFTSNGTTVDHVQPANVTTKGDQPRSEFLVNTFNFNFGCSATAPCNGLIIWQIHDGVYPGKATSNGVTISTPHNYIQPFSAAQRGADSGTTCAINTGTVGITGTVNWTAGDLYVATTTGALNGQVSDGWEYWQIHPYLDSTGALEPSPNLPVIRNEICWGCFGFSGDSTLSEYYPTAQPDDEGNVTVVYNTSGHALSPSVGYVSQRTTQNVGGFPDGGLFLMTGSGEYCQLDKTNRNRWGDETASAPYGTYFQGYPTFWFSGPYSQSSSNGTTWATQIGQTAFTSAKVP